MFYTVLPSEHRVGLLASSVSSLSSHWLSVLVFPQDHHVMSKGHNANQGSAHDPCVSPGFQLRCPLEVRGSLLEASIAL